MSTAIWTDGLWKDVLFTTRALRRSPAFTGAVVLMLSLGLGANAAIFSFLDQIFLRPPAGISSPATLRRLWLQQPVGLSKIPEITHSLNYHAYRAIAASLGERAQLALYATETQARIGRGDAPATETITYATASYFPTLGVRPTAGRAFTDAEADVHSASPVVVVSDAFWRRQLGADRAVVGKTLTVDDRDYTIIGIAPRYFSGVDLQESALWLPIGMFPTRDVARVSFWDSSIITFSVFARVAPGTNDHLLEARATNAYRLAPVTDFAPNPSAEVLFRSIIDARGPGATPRELSIAIRLAFVAIVILLLTTANALNLLLARSMGRRREAAVRLALGISRWRLLRLFVMESALLSLLAGAAALLSAYVAGGALRSLLLPGTQFAEGPLRWQLMAFIIVLAIVTGVLTGIVPAVHAGRTDLTISLKAGARDGAFGRSLLPRALVAVQTALSVVLLAGAVLFVTSLRNVNGARTGFDVPKLAYASIVLPSGERADTMAFAASMRNAGDRVRHLPGVEAVAFARDEPMTGFGRVTFYTDTDSSSAPGRPAATANYVSSQFFNAVGASFIRGATFSDQAGASASAVVVNETLARLFWPDRDPVGQCIRIQRRDDACLIVTGVVEDAIRQQLLEQPAPQLYLPIFQSVRGQRPPRVMVIRVESPRVGAAMAEASHALRSAFPRGQPEVVRMADRLAPQYRPWNLGAALFGAFGLLALVIAALGIYSSVSYSVAQRGHELGVRIALGATFDDVMRAVVGRGVRPVLVGSVVGAAITIAGERLVSSLLYGIDARNPAPIMAVVLALVIVGVMAACIPGWRATRIDPKQAMAGE